MMSPPFSSLPRMTQAPISLNLSSTLPSSKFETSPALKLLGGSDRTFGNRKRTVPSVMPSIDNVNVVQAAANQEPKKASVVATKKLRRVGSFGACAAGLAGTGGFAGGAPGATP